MPTYTALTTLTSEDGAQKLGEALEGMSPSPTGVGVFEIEDGSGAWEVGGYFTETPDDVALSLLAAVHDAAPFAVSRLPDVDWVAQVRRELTPVQAGRVIVHGAHDAHRIPINRIGLRIEAAMAFGTGHHQTTLGCLMALEDMRKAGLAARTMLDVGCGTGVLAMAAAAIWKTRALATDIDPIAVAAARENVRANGLGSLVRTECATGVASARTRSQAPYDLITANILAGPLRRLAPSVAPLLAPGGRIVLSGVLNRQARRVEQVYLALGLRREKLRGIGEWTTLVLRRP